MGLKLSDWISEKDAAAKFSIEAKTLRRKIITEKVWTVNYSMLSERIVFYLKADLENIINQHSTTLKTA